ncbi:MAG: penicillin-binding protein 1A [Succinivibrionaceae bacterium]
MLFIWLRRFIWFCLLIISLITAALCFYYYHVQSTLPNVEQLKHVNFETPLKIYTIDQKLIGEYGEHRRIPLKIEQIPQNLKNAFLAIEDSRFYEHYGIDPIGIMRAAYVSILNGRKTQGASTITQQVARNFFLSNEKTYTRKIKEIFLSWKIEQSLTKDEILELYLNKIALGHHSFGVAAAAYVYFGKNINELTLGEIAIIAGLPKAPSNLNPISHPQRAKERRHLVLKRMLELGMISKEDFTEADNEPIVAKYHAAEIEVNAPYVAESIRQKLENTYGKSIYTEGYKAYATISSTNQEAANLAVFNGLTEYDQRHGYRKPFNVIKNYHTDINNEKSIKNALKTATTYEFIKPAIVISTNNDNSANIYVKNQGYGKISWSSMKWARAFKTDSYTGPIPQKVGDVLNIGDLIYVTSGNNENEYKLSQVPQVQGALISLDSHTGAILAMVGGYSFKQSSFNRVEQAKRQAGSNLKPFLYSAGLANGYSLATLMLDDRISIWNPWSKTNWSPKNSPNRYEGIIPLRMALAKSKNVVSVRLLRSVGLENFVTHLQKFGFEVSRFQKNESLALGAYEVTPLELATAYSAFANGGYKIEPYIIDKVTIGEQNTVIYRANPMEACRNCKDAVKNQIEPEQIPEVAQKLIAENYAEQIISHSNSFLISSALSSVIFGGTYTEGKYWGTGGKAQALKRHDIAGKTGTTNESRDAWFSGFNANVVTTVWVGFDNFARTLGRMESGGKASLPIWIDYMKTALKDMPNSPVLPDSSIIKSNVAGYPEYFVKDIPIVINTPYMDEEGDFSTGTTSDSGKKQESIDDIF